MKFVMARDHTVSSLKGHSVAFVKGEPTFVPPALYSEVEAAGGVPDGALPEKAAPVPGASIEPTDPALRKAALFAAFDTIALRNRREDFTAGGAPHGTVLASVLGWSVQPKERDIVWAEFRAGNDE